MEMCSQQLMPSIFCSLQPNRNHMKNSMKARFTRFMLFATMAMLMLFDFGSSNSQAAVINAEVVEATADLRVRFVEQETTGGQGQLIGTFSDQLTNGTYGTARASVTWSLNSFGQGWSINDVDVATTSGGSASAGVEFLLESDTATNISRRDINVTQVTDVATSQGLPINSPQPVNLSGSISALDFGIQLANLLQVGDTFPGAVNTPWQPMFGNDYSFPVAGNYGTAETIYLETELVEAISIQSTNPMTSFTIPETVSTAEDAFLLIADGNGIPITGGQSAIFASPISSVQLVGINPAELVDPGASRLSFGASFSSSGNVATATELTVTGISDPGFSESNPILPNDPESSPPESDPPIGIVNGEPWGFGDVVSGRTYDPVLADGFFYQTDGSADFTVIGLPSSLLDSEYVITDSINGSITLSAGSFYTFPTPVSEFVISDINPAVNGEDPLAFPTYLEFSEPTATFWMTPLSLNSAAPVPEPSSGFLLVGAIFLSRMGYWRRRSRA